MIISDLCYLALENLQTKKISAERLQHIS